MLCILQAEPSYGLLAGESAWQSLGNFLEDPEMGGIPLPG